jgi:hypothetical protein
VRKCGRHRIEHGATDGLLAKRNVRFRSPSEWRSAIRRADRATAGVQRDEAAPVAKVTPWPDGTIAPVNVFGALVAELTCA